MSGLASIFGAIGRGAVKAGTAAGGINVGSLTNGVLQALSTWGNLNVAYYQTQGSINQARADANKTTGSVPAALQEAGTKLADLAPALIASAAVIGVAMVMANAGKRR